MELGGRTVRELGHPEIVVSLLSALEEKGIAA
jgi:hypothetical protein